MFEVPQVMSIYPTNRRPTKSVSHHIDIDGIEDNPAQSEETDSNESCYFSGSGTVSQHSTRDETLDEEEVEETATILDNCQAPPVVTPATSSPGTTSSGIGNSTLATVMVTTSLHVQPRGTTQLDTETIPLCSARSLSGVGLVEVQCDTAPSVQTTRQSVPLTSPLPPPSQSQPPIQVLPAVTIVKPKQLSPSPPYTRVALSVPTTSSSLPAPSQNRRKSSVTALAIDKIKSIFHRSGVSTDGSSTTRNDSVTTITGSLSRRESILSYNFPNREEETTQPSGVCATLRDFFLCKTNLKQGSVGLNKNRFAQVITCLVVVAFLGIVIAILVKMNY